ncbi:uncharacterized protein LOC143286834 isoform X2 [Babylonia areolata]|uniref:uncharacterized protein LOC143286834 isoform X2 n=1 Tax=Babylonia areolata TaxID=304850 RepID=UPI003FD1D070
MASLVKNIHSRSLFPHRPMVHRIQSPPQSETCGNFRRLKMVRKPKDSKDQLGKNIMDPASWSLSDSDLETADDSSIESQSDKCQYKNQLKLDINIPKQLSSSRCYGRGKSLEDIAVPRLPKIFQDEFFLPDDADFWPTTASKGLRASTKHQGTQRQITTVGRGKMIQDHSVSLKTELADSELSNACGKHPAQSSVTRTDHAISCPPKHRSILIDNSEFAFEPSAPVFQPPDFCFESSEDFPGLTASVSSRPVHRIHKISTQPRCVKASESKDTSSVFEDTEESASASSCRLPKTLNSSQGPMGIIPKSSDSSVDPCESPLNSMFVENKEDMKDESTDNCSELSVSQIPRNIITVSGIQCSDTSELNDGGDNIPLKVKSQGGDNVSPNMKPEASPSRKQTDSEECAVTKVPPAIENTCPGASAEDTCTKESRPPVKPRKKSVTGWKLEDALVVHVGNVPKGCGEQLKHCISNFGKILDMEKKSKKGINAWRFRFETREICDYVVECLNGAELFDGFSNALECYHLDGDEDD